MQKQSTPIGVPENNSRPAMSVNEFAEMYRVKPMTVYREIKRGNLAAVRLGRAIRITPQAAAEYFLGDAASVGAGEAA